MRHRVLCGIFAVLMAVMCCGCANTKESCDLTVCGIVTEVSEEQDLLKVKITVAGYEKSGAGYETGFYQNIYYSHNVRTEEKHNGYVTENYTKELILMSANKDYSQYAQVIKSAGDDYVYKFKICGNEILSVSSLGKKCTNVKWYPVGVVTLMEDFISLKDYYVSNGGQGYFVGIGFSSENEIFIRITTEDNLLKDFYLTGIPEARFFKINLLDKYWMEKTLIKGKDGTNVLVNYDNIGNKITFDVFCGEVEFGYDGELIVTDLPDAEARRIKVTGLEYEDEDTEIIINYMEEWENAG